MKKKLKFGSILILMILSSFFVSGVEISDSFNDGIINPTIWYSVTTSGNLLLREGLPELPADETLIFNFEFDEVSGTIASEDKQGNDATYQNFPNLTTAGTSNTGVWFDGIDDYIDWQPLGNYDLTSSENMVMCFGFNGYVDFRNDNRLLDFLGATGYSITGDDDEMVFTMDRSISGVTTIKSVTHFDDSTWHKVCIASTFDNLTLWIDGVLDKTQADTMNGSVTLPTDELLIGVNDARTQYFEGGFDEFCYYKGESMDISKIINDYNDTSLCTDYDIPQDIFGHIRIYGNESSIPQPFLTTLETIPASENGEASIKVRTIGASSNGNDVMFFGITDKDENDSWVSAPPTWCGVMFFKQGNQNFAFLRNYPSASIIFNTQISEDNLEHDVNIAVRREPDNNRTCYDMTFDDNTSTYCQDTGCQNPTLNVSFSARSTGNPPLEYRFDDFRMGAFVLLGLVGDYCDDDDDCESGLCEYGFCTLKGARIECTSNAECISGICSNGHCTQASLWESMEASKTQQFGDSPMTNNFVSLFFMIGLPIMVIINSGHILGVLAGLGIYFALGIFFTVVGWLNPFFLIGSILVVLIGLVFGFLLLSGGSD